MAFGDNNPLYGRYAQEDFLQSGIEQASRFSLQLHAGFLRVGAERTMLPRQFKEEHDLSAPGLTVGGRRFDLPMPDEIKTLADLQDAYSNARTAEERDTYYQALLAYESEGRAAEDKQGVVSINTMTEIELYLNDLSNPTLGTWGVMGRVSAYLNSPFGSASDARGLFYAVSNPFVQLPGTPPGNGGAREQLRQEQEQAILGGTKAMLKMHYRDMLSTTINTSSTLLGMPDPNSYLNTTMMGPGEMDSAFEIVRATDPSAQGVRPGIAPAMGLITSRGEPAGQTNLYVDIFQFQNQSVIDTLVHRLASDPGLTLNLTVATPEASNEAVNMAILGTNLTALGQINTLVETSREINALQTRMGGGGNLTPEEQSFYDQFAYLAVGPGQTDLSQRVTVNYGSARTHPKLLVSEILDAHGQRTGGRAIIGTMNLTNPLGDDIYGAGSNLEMISAVTYRDNATIEAEVGRLGDTPEVRARLERDNLLYGQRLAIEQARTRQAQVEATRQTGAYPPTLGNLTFTADDTRYYGTSVGASTLAGYETVDMRGTYEHLTRSISYLEREGKSTPELQMVMLLDQPLLLQGTDLLREQAKTGAYRKEFGEYDPGMIGQVTGGISERYGALQKATLGQVIEGRLTIGVDVRNFREQVLNPLLWAAREGAAGDNLLGFIQLQRARYSGAGVPAEGMIDQILGGYQGATGRSLHADIFGTQVAPEVERDTLRTLLALSSGGIREASVPKAHAKAYSIYTRGTGGEIVDVGGYLGSSNLTPFALQTQTLHDFHGDVDAYRSYLDNLSMELGEVSLNPAYNAAFLGGTNLQLGGVEMLDPDATQNQLLRQGQTGAVGQIHAQVLGGLVRRGIAESLGMSQAQSRSFFAGAPGEVPLQGDIHRAQAQTKSVKQAFDLLVGQLKQASVTDIRLFEEVTTGLHGEAAFAKYEAAFHKLYRADVDPYGMTSLQDGRGYKFANLGGIEINLESSLTTGAFDAISIRMGRKSFDYTIIPDSDAVHSTASSNQLSGRMVELNRKAYFRSGVFMSSGAGEFGTPFGSISEQSPLYLNSAETGIMGILGSVLEFNYLQGIAAPAQAINLVSTLQGHEQVNARHQLVVNLLAQLTYGEASVESRSELWRILDLGLGTRQNDQFNNWTDEQVAKALQGPILTPEAREALLNRQAQGQARAVLINARIALGAVSSAGGRVAGAAYNSYTAPEDIDRVAADLAREGHFSDINKAKLHIREVNRQSATLTNPVHARLSQVVAPILPLIGGLLGDRQTQRESALQSIEQLLYGAAEGHLTFEELSSGLGQALNLTSREERAQGHYLSDIFALMARGMNANWYDMTKMSEQLLGTLIPVSNLTQAANSQFNYTRGKFEVTGEQKAFLSRARRGSQVGLGYLYGSVGYNIPMIADPKKYGGEGFSQVGGGVSVVGDEYASTAAGTRTQEVATLNDWEALEAVGLGYFLHEQSIPDAIERMFHGAGGLLDPELQESLTAQARAAYKRTEEEQQAKGPLGLMVTRTGAISKLFQLAQRARNAMGTKYLLPLSAGYIQTIDQLRSAPDSDRHEQAMSDLRARRQLYRGELTGGDERLEAELRTVMGITKESFEHIIDLGFQYESDIRPLLSPADHATYEKMRARLEEVHTAYPGGGFDKTRQQRVLRAWAVFNDQVLGTSLTGAHLVDEGRKGYTWKDAPVMLLQLGGYAQDSVYYGNEGFGRYSYNEHGQALDSKGQVTREHGVDHAIIGARYATTNYQNRKISNYTLLADFSVSDLNIGVGDYVDMDTTTYKAKLVRATGGSQDISQVQLRGILGQVASGEAEAIGDEELIELIGGIRDRAITPTDKPYEARLGARIQVRFAHDSVEVTTHVGSSAGVPKGQTNVHRVSIRSRLVSSSDRSEAQFGLFKGVTQTMTSGSFAAPVRQYNEGRLYSATGGDLQVGQVHGMANISNLKSYLPGHGAFILAHEGRLENLRGGIQSHTQLAAAALILTFGAETFNLGGTEASQAELLGAFSDYARGSGNDLLLSMAAAQDLAGPQAKHFLKEGLGRYEVNTNWYTQLLNARAGAPVDLAAVLRGEHGATTSFQRTLDLLLQSTGHPLNIGSVEGTQQEAFVAGLDVGLQFLAGGKHLGNTPVSFEGEHQFALGALPMGLTDAEIYELQRPGNEDALKAYQYMMGGLAQASSLVAMHLSINPALAKEGAGSHEHGDIELQVQIRGLQLARQALKGAQEHRGAARTFFATLRHSFTRRGSAFEHSLGELLDVVSSQGQGQEKLSTYLENEGHTNIAGYYLHAQALALQGDPNLTGTELREATQTIFGEAHAGMKLLSQAIELYREHPNASSDVLASKLQGLLEHGPYSNTQTQKPHHLTSFRQVSLEAGGQQVSLEQFIGGAAGYSNAAVLEGLQAYQKVAMRQMFRQVDQDHIYSGLYIIGAAESFIEQGMTSAGATHDIYLELPSILEHRSETGSVKLLRGGTTGVLLGANTLKSLGMHKLGDTTHRVAAEQLAMRAMFSADHEVMEFYQQVAEYFEKNPDAQSIDLDHIDKHVLQRAYKFQGMLRDSVSMLYEVAIQSASTSLKPNLKRETRVVGSSMLIGEGLAVMGRSIFQERSEVGAQEKGERADFETEQRAEIASYDLRSGLGHGLTQPQPQTRGLTTIHRLGLGTDYRGTTPEEATARKELVQRLDAQQPLERAVIESLQAGRQGLETKLQALYALQNNALTKSYQSIAIQRQVGAAEQTLLDNIRAGLKPVLEHNYATEEYTYKTYWGGIERYAGLEVKVAAGELPTDLEADDPTTGHIGMTVGGEHYAYPHKLGSKATGRSRGRIGASKLGVRFLSGKGQINIAEVTSPDTGVTKRRRILLDSGAEATFHYLDEQGDIKSVVYDDLGDIHEALAFMRGAFKGGHFLYMTISPGEETGYIHFQHLDEGASGKAELRLPGDLSEAKRHAAGKAILESAVGAGVVVTCHPELWSTKTPAGKAVSSKHIMNMALPGKPPNINPGEVLVTGRLSPDETQLSIFVDLMKPEAAQTKRKRQGLADLITQKDYGAEEIAEASQTDWISALDKTKITEYDAGKTFTKEQTFIKEVAGSLRGPQRRFFLESLESTGDIQDALYNVMLHRDAPQVRTKLALSGELPLEDLIRQHAYARGVEQSPRKLIEHLGPGLKSHALRHLYVHMLNLMESPFLPLKAMQTVRTEALKTLGRNTGVLETLHEGDVPEIMQLVSRRFREQLKVNLGAGQTSAEALSGAMQQALGEATSRAAELYYGRAGVSPEQSQQLHREFVETAAAQPEKAPHLAQGTVALWTGGEVTGLHSAQWYDYLEKSGHIPERSPDRKLTPEQQAVRSLHGQQRSLYLEKGLGASLDSLWRYLDVTNLSEYAPRLDHSDILTQVSYLTGSELPQGLDLTKMGAHPDSVKLFFGRALYSLGRGGNLDEAITQSLITLTQKHAKFLAKIGDQHAGLLDVLEQGVERSRVLGPVGHQARLGQLLGMFEGHIRNLYPQKVEPAQKAATTQKGEPTAKKIIPTPKVEAAPLTGPSIPEPAPTVKKIIPAVEKEPAPSPKQVIPTPRVEARPGVTPLLEGLLNVNTISRKVIDKEASPGFIGMGAQSEVSHYVDDRYESRVGTLLEPMGAEGVTYGSRKIDNSGRGTDLNKAFQYIALGQAESLHYRPDMRFTVYELDTLASQPKLGRDSKGRLHSLEADGARTQEYDWARLGPQANPLQKLLGELEGSRVVSGPHDKTTVLNVIRDLMTGTSNIGDWLKQQKLGRAYKGTTPEQLAKLGVTAKATREGYNTLFLAYSYRTIEGKEYSIVHTADYFEDTIERKALQGQRIYAVEGAGHHFHLRDYLIGQYEAEHTYADGTPRQLGVHLGPDSIARDGTITTMRQPRSFELQYDSGSGHLTSKLGGTPPKQIISPAMPEKTPGVSTVEQSSKLLADPKTPVIPTPTEQSSRLIEPDKVAPQNWLSRDPSTETISSAPKQPTAPRPAPRDLGLTNLTQQQWVAYLNEHNFLIGRRGDGRKQVLEGLKGEARQRIVQYVGNKSTLDRREHIDRIDHIKSGLIELLSDTYRWGSGLRPGDLSFSDIAIHLNYYYGSDNYSVNKKVLTLLNSYENQADPSLGTRHEVFAHWLTTLGEADTGGRGELTIDESIIRPLAKLVGTNKLVGLDNILNPEHRELTRGWIEEGMRDTSVKNVSDRALKVIVGLEDRWNKYWVKDGHLIPPTSDGVTLSSPDPSMATRILPVPKSLSQKQVNELTVFTTEAVTASAYGHFQQYVVGRYLLPDGTYNQAGHTQELQSLQGILTGYNQLPKDAPERGQLLPRMRLYEAQVYLAYSQAAALTIQGEHEAAKVQLATAQRLRQNLERFQSAYASSGAFGQVEESRLVSDTNLSARRSLTGAGRYNDPELLASTFKHLITELQGHLKAGAKGTSDPTALAEGDTGGARGAIKNIIAELGVQWRGLQAGTISTTDAGMALFRVESKLSVLATESLIYRPQPAGGLNIGELIHQTLDVETYNRLILERVGGKGVNTDALRGELMQLSVARSRNILLVSVVGRMLQNLGDYDGDMVILIETNLVDLRTRRAQLGAELGFLQNKGAPPEEQNRVASLIRELDGDIRSIETKYSRSYHHQKARQFLADLVGLDHSRLGSGADSHLYKQLRQLQQEALSADPSLDRVVAAQQAESDITGRMRGARPTGSPSRDNLMTDNRLVFGKDARGRELTFGAFIAEVEHQVDVRLLTENERVAYMTNPRQGYLLQGAQQRLIQSLGADQYHRLREVYRQEIERQLLDQALASKTASRHFVGASTASLFYEHQKGEGLQESIFKWAGRADLVDIHGAFTTLLMTGDTAGAKATLENLMGTGRPLEDSTIAHLYTLGQKYLAQDGDIARRGYTGERAYVTAAAMLLQDMHQIMTGELPSEVDALRKHFGVQSTGALAEPGGVQQTMQVQAELSSNILGRAVNFFSATLYSEASTGAFADLLTVNAPELREIRIAQLRDDAVNRGVSTDEDTLTRHADLDIAQWQEGFAQETRRYEMIQGLHQTWGQALRDFIKPPGDVQQIIAQVREALKTASTPAERSAIINKLAGQVGPDAKGKYGLGVLTEFGAVVGLLHNLPEISHTEGTAGLNEGELKIMQEHNVVEEYDYELLSGALGKRRGLTTVSYRERFRGVLAYVATTKLQMLTAHIRAASHLTDKDRLANKGDMHQYDMLDGDNGPLDLYYGRQQSGRFMIRGQHSNDYLAQQEASRLHEFIGQYSEKLYKDKDALFDARLLEQDPGDDKLVERRRTLMLLTQIYHQSKEAVEALAGVHGTGLLDPRGLGMTTDQMKSLAGTGVLETAATQEYVGAGFNAWLARAGVGKPGMGTAELQNSLLRMMLNRMNEMTWTDDQGQTHQGVSAEHMAAGGFKRMIPILTQMYLDVHGEHLQGDAKASFDAVKSLILYQVNPEDTSGHGARAQVMGTLDSSAVGGVLAELRKIYSVYAHALTMRAERRLMVPMTDAEAQAGAQGARPFLTAAELKEVITDYAITHVNREARHQRGMTQLHAFHAEEQAHIIGETYNNLINPLLMAIGAGLSNSNGASHPLAEFAGGVFTNLMYSLETHRTNRLFETAPLRALRQNFTLFSASVLSGTMFTIRSELRDPNKSYGDAFVSAFGKRITMDMTVAATTAIMQGHAPTAAGLELAGRLASKVVTAGLKRVTAMAPAMIASRIDAKAIGQSVLRTFEWSARVAAGGVTGMLVEHGMGPDLDRHGYGKARGIFNILTSIAAGVALNLVSAGHQQTLTLAAEDRTINNFLAGQSFEAMRQSLQLQQMATLAAAESKLEMVDSAASDMVVAIMSGPLGNGEFSSVYSAEDMNRISATLQGDEGELETTVGAPTPNFLPTPLRFQGAESNSIGYGEMNYS